MVKGVTSFMCAAVVAVALVAAGGAHAGKDLFALKVAKHKDGPYKTDVKSNFDPGQTRSFWWRVRSQDVQPRGLVFLDDDTSDQDGYATSWFRGGKNVSDDVEATGKEFILDPGQTKYFKARQTAPSPAVGTCVAGQVTDGEDQVFSAVNINGTKCAF